MSRKLHVAISVEAVEAALLELYIGESDATTGRKLALRDEDRKKAREVAALLEELARSGRRDLVVDAAAGHAYLGLLCARFLGIGRLVIIEREAGRAERCRRAAAGLDIETQLRELEIEAADVADISCWPQSPDIVVALHACGPASDAIIDRAIDVAARRLLLVPCCHGASLRFAATAIARADSLGLPRQAEVRNRFLRSLVDAERTLRLEAAGYEVQLVAFVPATVTSHNLLFRARRVIEPRRMEEARRRLVTLTGE